VKLARETKRLTKILQKRQITSLPVFKVGVQQRQ